MGQSSDQSHQKGVKVIRTREYQPIRMGTGLPGDVLAPKTVFWRKTIGFEKEWTKTGALEKEDTQIERTLLMRMIK